MARNELFTSSIPNFSNGISQQPYSLRLSSQGEAQENGLSSISQGLQKRPPTKHLKKLSSTPVTSAFTHSINRDSTEQYQVIIANDDLKVYDLVGTEQTVAFPDGKDYLKTTGDVEDSFSAVSIADYTFIANKTVKCLQGTAKSEAQAPVALLLVKLGNYGRTYKVLINGVVMASFETPTGANAEDTKKLSTDYIAAQLFNQLIGFVVTETQLTYQATNVYTLPEGCTQANLLNVSVSEHYHVGERDKWRDYVTVGVTWIDSTTFSLNSLATDAANLVRISFGAGTANPYNASLHGSIIQIPHGEGFSVTTEDGFNNTALVAITGSVQKFSSLPANPKLDGVIIEVAGSGDGNFDNYWVTYDSSEGIWKETLKADTVLGMNATTLPHALVREADGTFTFGKVAWADRTVGDAVTVPDPSFVGKTINNIFFYQNRLGFLSDENVIFSQAGEFFNFYRTTLTTVLDSSPIDVATAHTKVTILEHAIPFEKQLFLFSQQTQFVLTYSEILTPSSVSVKPTTEFPCNTKAQPLVVGKNIYFGANRGNWSSAHEFYTDATTYTNNVTEVTGHIPEYIPKDVTKIAAAHNENILFLLSKDEPSSLFVYKYYWSGNEKLQSSWSKWTFGSDTSILSVTCLESQVLLLVNRSDGLYLERIDATLNLVEPDEPFQIFLDRKVSVPSSALTYSEGFTTISTEALGYIPGTGVYQAVVKSGSGKPIGDILDVVVSEGVCKVKGDYTGCTLAVGKQYRFRYVLSTITPKTVSSSGTQRSITEGRLQLRRLNVKYADSGRFTVLVTPTARDTMIYTFLSRVLGTSTLLGKHSFTTGKFSVPVQSRNTEVNVEIMNDTPLACSILSADWEGYYVKRSLPM